MSAPMKKPRTETVMVGNVHFEVPKETAKAVLVLLQGSQVVDNETILADESDVIKKLDSKFSSAGACLQGARLKEDMTQEELAEKLRISQTNLSKMEHGKRPIGKSMAKRIAKVLKVDYRIFL
jgi:ribosome-binding protein aMBF1 (putative translation factor)